MIKKYKYKISLLFVLIIGIVIYYPGLSGGLILDDESNLSPLQSISGKISLESLREYIGLSKSGILKRPISVLSFLIDANNWPTDLWQFKRTNLFIHLFNGLLLFTLYFKIFQNNKKIGVDAYFIALLGMTLWMLHPFLVSSVLYIVQRMAMLTATFVLLGLLFYVIGRERYEKSSGSKGRLYMLIGVYLMPVFAVLSKENGILLVYFILLFEVFIYRYFHLYNEIKKQFRYIIYFPAIVTTIALSLKMPSFIHSYGLREFSLLERILTEFRALTTYLYHIFIPEYFTEGAYTDGFKVSHGIFDPITTFLSIIFVFAVIFYAWIARKKRPLISFSIFFFFVAHLLESTIIPLELYYEHRNYIPMLFIFLPLVLYINQLRKNHKVIYVLIFVLVTVLGSLTLLRTNMWGDDLNLHLKTVNKYPESTRAVTMLGIKYKERNELINSYKIMKNSLNVNNALELQINYLNILCLGKLIKVQHLEALYQVSKVNIMTRTSLPPFQGLFTQIIGDKCGIGEPIKNARILSEILKHNSFESSIEEKPITYFFNAQIEFKLKNFKQAESWFIQSFYWKHDYDSLFLFTQDLINHNQLEISKNVLDMGYQTYQSDFKYYFDWLNYGKTFQELREYIKLKNK